MSAKWARKATTAQAKNFIVVSSAIPTISGHPRPSSAPSPTSKTPADLLLGTSHPTWPESCWSRWSMSHIRHQISSVPVSHQLSPTSSATVTHKSDRWAQFGHGQPQHPRRMERPLVPEVIPYRLRSAGTSQSRTKIRKDACLYLMPNPISVHRSKIYKYMYDLILHPKFKFWW
jgi:hypothetical protein